MEICNYHYEIGSLELKPTKLKKKKEKKRLKGKIERNLFTTCFLGITYNNKE